MKRRKVSMKQEMKNTALLVMDVQPGTVNRLENKDEYIEKVSASAVMIDPRPAIELADNDVVVVKRRVSAFSGSDLEVLLRAWDIEHLVLTVIATSGVVLSTTREAADKDYQLTILSDLCADFDAEVHAVLLKKVFPLQATVITIEEWINTIHS